MIIVTCQVGTVLEKCYMVWRLSSVADGVVGSVITSSWAATVCDTPSPHLCRPTCHGWSPVAWLMMQSADDWQQQWPRHQMQQQQGRPKVSAVMRPVLLAPLPLLWRWHRCRRKQQQPAVSCRYITSLSCMSCELTIITPLAGCVQGCHLPGRLTAVLQWM